VITVSYTYKGAPYNAKVTGSCGLNATACPAQWFAQAPLQKTATGYINPNLPTEFRLSLPLPVGGIVVTVILAICGLVTAIVPSIHAVIAFLKEDAFHQKAAAESQEPGADSEPFPSKDDEGQTPTGGDGDEKPQAATADPQPLPSDEPQPPAYYPTCEPLGYPPNGPGYPASAQQNDGYGAPPELQPSQVEAV
jgi:hypothetical protein